MGWFVILAMAFGFASSVFVSLFVSNELLSDIFGWCALIVAIVGHYFVFKHMSD